MSKHTEGKWIANHDKEALASYIVVENELYPHVVMCSYTIGGGPTREEQIANIDRIAICKEALDGIPNSALENGVIGDMRGLVSKVNLEIEKGHSMISDESVGIIKAILTKLEGGGK